MILKIVKFCTYINTIMRKSINWENQEEQIKYQDMDLQWMTNANSQCALERFENVNKDMPFWDQSGDTEKNFQKLVSSGIPNYWRFHTKEFIYRFNSFGFRAPEFDTVDWKNSYVIVGCSHVQGIGNPFDETIGQYISKELGHPVINMGVGGISISGIYNNILKLIKDYGKPKGMFILWTYPWRFLAVDNYYVFEDRDNYIKPFWGRKDIVGGTFQNQVNHNTAPISFDDSFLARQFHTRSICIESTKQLLKGVSLSMITDPYCWTLDCHVKDMGDEHKIIIPVPEEFREQLRNFNKENPNTWKKTTDKCKEWYLNQVKARDIERFNPKGPGTSHWGKLINQHIANHFVKILNETTIQQD